VADDDDKKKNVIIIKKKKGHGGAHGGAWKVAYADFVTAMMAFFLLMWLLNAATKEQKEAIADYFNDKLVMTEGGSTFIRKESPNKKDADNKKKSDSKPTVIQLNPEDFEGQKNVPMELWGKQKLKPKEFAEHFQEDVSKKLGDMKDQIKVEVTEDGVRVQLVDADGREMFQAGSQSPTALGRRALNFVAESFKKMPNNIAVEGHTDATGQDEGKNGNWALSSQRALSARAALEDEGVNATNFERVTGYADTDLYVKNDPTDPRNRRVAITLLFPKPQFQQEEDEEGEPAPPKE